MKNFHALFIGVDAYQKVSSLNGCVNDALMMFEYLNTTIDQKSYHFQAQFLLSIHSGKASEFSKRFQNYKFDYEVNAKKNLPTRDNILNRIKQYQNIVAPGDVFFLFYAGHGSTETAHPYFDEDTGDLQTLVPSDARVQVRVKNTKTGKETTTKIKDVLDKEIRFLLRKIWEKGTEEHPVEMIFIQDSCHSAGASRDDLDNAVKAIEAVVFEKDHSSESIEETSEEQNSQLDFLNHLNHGEEEKQALEETHSLPTTEVDDLEEEALVAPRMVFADDDASQYRPIEELGFYDLLTEEEREAMRAYETTEEEDLSHKINPIIEDYEEKADLARGLDDADVEEEVLEEEPRSVFMDLEELDAGEQEDQPRSIFLEVENNNEEELVEEETFRGISTEKNLSSRGTGEGTKRTAKRQPPFEVAYPEAHHIHMSACGKAEYAYEIKYSRTTADGQVIEQKGGVFTNTIISILREHQGNISYHDLFNAAKLRIDGQFKQSPSIYVKGNPSRRYERFLGGYLEKKEGVYDLIYKSKFNQWRASVGAFLGLPVLKIDQVIPVEVFFHQQPDQIMKANITYVLAETAVVEFEGHQPELNAKGLKIRIDPQYMSQALPVAIEQRVNYELNAALDSDYQAAQEATARYILEPQAESLRLYLRHKPEEYVDLSYYSTLEAGKLPYEIQDLQLDYDPTDRSYLNYELWTLLEPSLKKFQAFNSGWVQFQFADGSQCSFDGEHLFQLRPNLDLNHLIKTEHKDIFTKFLNTVFGEIGALQQVYLPDYAAYPNPFLSHLEKLNLEAFQHHIKWSTLPNAAYQVRVRNGRYYIVDPKNPERLLSRGTEGLGPESAAKVLGYLRSISRWHMLKDLENPHPESRQLLKTLDLNFKVVHYDDGEGNIKADHLTVQYVVSAKERKFQWYKNGQPIDTLDLEYSPSSAHEKNYLLRIELTRKGNVSEQTFFGSLYLDYDFAIKPQDGVGSTEFLLYTPEKKAHVDIQVKELRAIPKIFKVPQEGEADHRPTTINTAIKFFIAYNRFDVSDWVQEGVPIPTAKDYSSELEIMRSVMGRKTDPKAGDCIVLTLPLQLCRPDIKISDLQKDNNSGSIRGKLNQ